MEMNPIVRWSLVTLLSLFGVSVIVLPVLRPMTATGFDAVLMYGVLILSSLYFFSSAYATLRMK